MTNPDSELKQEDRQTIDGAVMQFTMPPWIKYVHRWLQEKRTREWEEKRQAIERKETLLNRMKMADWILEARGTMEQQQSAPGYVEKLPLSLSLFHFGWHFAKSNWGFSECHLSPMAANKAPDRYRQMKASKLCSF